jgi:hypothetical protein
LAGELVHVEITEIGRIGVDGRNTMQMGAVAVRTVLRLVPGSSKPTR